MQPEQLKWWNDIARHLGGMFLPSEFKILLRQATLSFMPLDSGFSAVAWKSSTGSMRESFDPVVTREAYSAEEAAERIRSTIAE